MRMALVTKKRLLRYRWRREEPPLGFVVSMPVGPIPVGLNMPVVVEPGVPPMVVVGVPVL